MTPALGAVILVVLVVAWFFLARWAANHKPTPIEESIGELMKPIAHVSSEAAYFTGTDGSSPAPYPDNDAEASNRDGRKK